FSNRRQDDIAVRFESGHRTNGGGLHQWIVVTKSAKQGGDGPRQFDEWITHKKPNGRIPYGGEPIGKRRKQDRTRRPANGGQAAQRRFAKFRVVDQFGEGGHGRRGVCSQQTQASHGGSSPQVSALQFEVEERLLVSQHRDPSL